MRLVQLTHPSHGRRVGWIEDRRLHLLTAHQSIYAFAMAAADSGTPLASLVEDDRTEQSLDYDEVYSLRSGWSFLPSFDHPSEPARCLISGTGLTHLASASQRNAMHAAATVTDSMRMYQLGVESGRPPAGEIGAAPEWFYKGCGTALRGHGAPLTIPNFAGDGGDEAELAAVYVIDAGGTPRRVGMTPANEFSDHRIEKQNYLYLAHSKLRTCAIGPELVLDADFSIVHGVVSIVRSGDLIWSKEISTGSERMCHSLANIEHHHFKYETHRRPGDAHIHFLGASAFSFGNGIELQDGDEMVIEWRTMGRALRNRVQTDKGPYRLVSTRPL